jgi:UDP-N-acetylmuramoyl-tripeptide--D-alanyl-D-alanine ligase
MENRTLNFVLKACAAKHLSGSSQAVIQRVCTDSRHVQPGDLFFAVAGEHFDGHDFVADAVQKGAVAIVVQQGRAPLGLGACAVIEVDDTRKALGRLAAHYRHDFDLAMVAVAGSNGKTTTKDLVAAVLKQKLATLSSEASFNNDIGVPLTLLKLERGHQAAVLEAGTNHPGELAPLAKMIAPRYGIVTSIAREHLEFFHDLAGVAEEEGALAESVTENGKLFINGDSEWSSHVVCRTKAKVARCGFEPGNDWRIAGVRLGKEGTSFYVETALPDYAGEYRINLLGRHQAGNALFAIALGVEMGLSRAEIERGLAECKPAKMRMQFFESKGVLVLDDAYNANADSMAAALRTLQELPCKGRRVAVLGDMAELGTESEASHEEVGRRAAELANGQLFAVGRMAEVVGRGARAGGLNRIFEFADVETAGTALKSFLKSGDVVLLKASRASRLERISEMLK